MNRRLAPYLMSILLALLPTVVRAQQNCEQIGREMEDVNNQIQQRSEQIMKGLEKNPDSVEAGKAAAEKLKASQAELTSLGQKAGELSKAFAKCLGMPMSKEEAKARQAETKSQIEAKKQLWNPRPSLTRI